MVDTSFRDGTLTSLMGSALSKAAQISGNAAFLAPAMLTSPFKDLPPRINKVSILLIKKLILVGNTPCFVARDDWQQGMPSDVFESFFAGVMQDYQGTMNKLLALIAMGSGNARATSKMLREALSLRPAPNQQGLLGALDILRTGDLRADLPSLEMPTLLIHGAHDKLASLSAAEWTAKTLLNAELLALPSAAHEPFISHPELFSQKVTEFLHA